MLGQIVKWLNSQFVKKCKYIETMERQDFENPEFSFFAGTLSVFLCIIFGSNAVAIKLAFAGVGVFTSAAIRFSIAALAIFLWTRVTGQTIGLKKGQLHQVLILAALFAIQLSMFYFGLSKSNASRGTLIVNLLPFWVLFLAHFFIPGDRITKRKFLGILLGFGGVAFMFAEKTGVTAGFRVGDLIILTATTIWACSVIYLKRIIGSFNPFQVTFYSMVFSVPIFFIEALLWDRPMIFKLNLQIIGAVLYQSLITAAFGFVAWNTLLQKYGAVALHSFIFIMPIAGVALGGLVMGDPITLKILIALVLIVVGILVVHLKPRKEEPVYPIRKGI
jgi:drug/metabolite transporter (DMT)-like permease